MPDPSGRLGCYARSRSRVQVSVEEVLHNSPDTFTPPFLFDDQTGELRVGNQRTWLSDRERDVLRALMKTPGELVLHSTLLEALWGTDDVPDRHATQVYVSRIRQKFRDVGGRAEWVKVVRGRGYVLDNGEAPLVQLTYDTDLFVVDVSPPDREFLGWDPKSVLGQFFLVTDGKVPHDDQQRASRAVRSLYELGLLESDALAPARTADGTSSMQRIKIEALPSEDGFRGMRVTIFL